MAEILEKGGRDRSMASIPLWYTAVAIMGNDGRVLSMRV